MERIIIGSKYFFSCYEDFQPHDTDEIEIIETTEFRNVKYIRDLVNKKCLFLLKKQSSRQDYINWALQCKSGMVIGQFLVPEFNAAIGLSVEDLKQLSPLLDRLDEKHMYEKIIYDAYIENNCFALTPEQRLAAYESYKQTRQENN